ncbi:MAG: LacI family transcriptional regulator [Chlorobi bacterium]|nr:LacI family transcriptional regulator [Chlorobiota bacterium]
MSVTIKDIARVLGISPSTVSRALKDHPDIAAETKRAVKELAEELNYQPDPIALSLKKRQSHIIGVLVPEIVHYFFSTVISGIEDLAYASGYRVMICQSNENFSHEVKNIDALLASRVDGILVSLSKETTSYRHLENIVEQRVPMVMFDRVAESLRVDKVVVDDLNGAYKAVSHLIEMGCRRIIHYGTAQYLAIGKNRREGYLRALADHNLPKRDEDIVRCDLYEDAVRITRGMMQRSPKPDAFFAVNDFTAIGTIKTLQELGYRVPEDVAVVGFTNGQIADVISPALTSVEQFGYNLGKTAVELLLERLNVPGKTIPARTRTIKTKLIIKASSLRKKIT